MRVPSLVITLVVLLVTPLEAAAQGSLDCVIEPYLTVSIASATDGLIEKVTVDRGDLVKKGQVLATLESSVERANVALAEGRRDREAEAKSDQAKFEFGVRRWDRTQELYKKTLVPLKELDEAETQKVLAEIGVQEGKENKRMEVLELDRARAALALRTITSPIDGVVTERLLSSGEFTKQGPILKLAQMDPLRVEVITPVSMMSKISVGMQAVVVPEIKLREPLLARVTVVDRVADAASGTFGVRLVIPNPNYKIPAGLKCKVRFGE